MRPVVKSNRTNEDGSPLSFRHWSDAKTDLQKEIGSFCSFCEREGYRSSLHVEHILPKGLAKYDYLKYRWDNFLLGCINCNSIKGNKDFDPAGVYLPHVNNIFFVIEILEGGSMRVRNDLAEDEKSRTLCFVDLVGLDRDPSHPLYSEKDDRWEARLDVWNTAGNFLKDYSEGEIRLARVIEMALATGYWSVWMQVFRSFPEVKGELIKQFAGTATSCFDEHFNPVPRNGDNP